MLCKPLVFKTPAPALGDRQLLVPVEETLHEAQQARKAAQRRRERFIEQQRLRELHDSSFRWVWCALLSGLVSGLGNYVLGIKLSKAGLLGPGFTGPVGLVILLVYRSIQMCQNKSKHKSCIYYKTSNWFKKNEKGESVFLKKHLKPLAGNFIPNLLGLISISMAFTYAGMSGLNQGILPTMLSLAGVYCGILFYFTFSEAPTVTQIIGMVLMIGAVVLIGLEGAQAGERLPTSNIAQVNQFQNAASKGTTMPEYMKYTKEERVKYAIIAVVWGLLAPVFFTMKAYAIRKYA